MTALLLITTLSLAADPIAVPTDRCIAARAERHADRQDFFDAAKAREATVRAVFEPAADARDLPHELLAVALIESGFEDHAPLPHYPHPAGVWQFIPSTARTYGLVVDRETDERRDLEKATGAALDLLSDLHAEHRDWGLAIAAYNVGSPRLNTVIADEKTRDLCTLIEAGALPPYAADVLAAIPRLDD